MRVSPSCYADGTFTTNQVGNLFTGCYLRINKLIDTLTDKLSLGFEQRAAITNILTYKAVQISALYDRADYSETIRKSKIRKISQSAIVKIKAVLVPEQRIVFDEIPFASAYNNTLRLDLNT
ncbi:MAG: hypothetical protein DVB35_01785 [Verrucomicrobia bacterium]|nr:MAG: hypothetical protein DVB35_01785 [Verrucomicrobiota bacterium]